jgi:hypothetical protein
MEEKNIPIAQTWDYRPERDERFKGLIRCDLAKGKRRFYIYDYIDTSLTYQPLGIGALFEKHLREAVEEAGLVIYAELMSYPPIYLVGEKR